MSAGSTNLLAMVLKTTPAVLRGSVEWQPGAGRSGPHPELRTLTPDQCTAHLSVGGLRPVVFSTTRGPVALPVNFEFSNGDVIISTDLAEAHALETQPIIGFEVDRVDDVMSEGWSVLITGHARRITIPTRSWRCRHSTSRAGLAVSATHSSPSAPRKSLDESSFIPSTRLSNRVRRRGLRARRAQPRPAAYPDQAKR